uniref:Uncharacterized protein n=1 Tax=Anguilla anguilla TaxID=7936 RepID=A0A0E9XBM6_ANGAN
MAQDPNALQLGHIHQLELPCQSACGTATLDCWTGDSCCRMAYTCLGLRPSTVACVSGRHGPGT